MFLFWYNTDVTWISLTMRAIFVVLVIIVVVVVVVVVVLVAISNAVVTLSLATADRNLACFSCSCIFDICKSDFKV